MAFTYRDLLNEMATWDSDQLDQDVTVHVSGVGEYFALLEDQPVEVAGPANDVLDQGHIYLAI